jgi:probable F420-dependent oxidoreductase
MADLEFYLPLAWTDPAHMLQLATAAEEAGFYGVAFSDHMIYPEDLHSPYPYGNDGKPHWTPSTPWVDPWVAMGHVAAVTSRVRFVTNIFVLPSRDPFTVAKSVGTVAVLSNNRVSMGVGVGWMREEYDVQGQDFTTRGKRSEEMIEILRRLWSGEMVDFHGEHYDFPKLQMSPMPSEIPPVYMGGYAPPVRDRIARIADGWISTNADVGQLADHWNDMERRLSEHGRDTEGFKYFAVCPSLDLDEYKRRADAGVTSLQSQPWTLYANDESARNRLNWPKNPASLELRLEGIKRFGEEVIGPLKAACVARP